MRADRTVLSDRGVIEVAGPDAREFLQRLVTSDVEALGSGEARYAALLTPQGKIITDFFVVAAREASDALYLDVPAAMVETLAKRLTLYRLRAKVTVTDRSAELGVAAFANDVPVEALVVYADPRAPGLWSRAIASHAALRDLGGDAGRWAYREQRVRAGIPEGGIDFVYGETFPHEANLDRLHGVDFTKGCYVGQEVVSRVQHRGTARKRVMGVRFEGDPPPVGSDITLDGAPIGTMGSTIEGVGLGLIRLDRAEEAGPLEGRVRAGGLPVRLEGPGWNWAGKSV